LGIIFKNKKYNDNENNFNNLRGSFNRSYN
jgi:hypothetical protein